MTRLLALAERHVDADARGAYLASLAARRGAAADAGVRFWAFEHLTEPGRFIEFTEAGDEAAIRRLAGGTVALWREVRQQDGGD